MIAGCSSQQSIIKQESPNITTTTQQVTSVPTLVPNQLVTQIATTDKSASFSGIDVNRHFLDLTFGRSNNYLTKISTDPDHKVSFTLNGKNTNDDAKIINDFAKNYNSFTSTSTFDSSPIRTDQKGILIEFYPQDYLKSLQTYVLTTTETDPTSGDILFIPGANGGITYINSDLSGDVRKHYIMKAMLISLGFQGTTNNYPDSFFYANNIDHVNLTPLDIADYKCNV